MPVEYCRQLAEGGKGSYKLVNADLVEGGRLRLSPSRLSGHTSIKSSRKIRRDQHRRDDQPAYEAVRNSDTKRVVIASFSAVYGMPEFLPDDEDHLTTLVTLYHISIHSLWLRMHPNMAISNLASNCLRGEATVLYGDGTQSRCFTYVDDILWANEQFLNTAAVNGEIMHIRSTDNIEIKNSLRKYVISSFSNSTSNIVSEMTSMPSALMPIFRRQMNSSIRN